MVAGLNEKQNEIVQLKRINIKIICFILIMLLFFKEIAHNVRSLNAAKAAPLQSNNTLVLLRLAACVRPA